MALKDLVITKDDLCDQCVMQRRLARRYERELRAIAQAKAASADRLREIATNAVRKNRVSK